MVDGLLNEFDDIVFFNQGILYFIDSTRTFLRLGEEVLKALDYQVKREVVSAPNLLNDFEVVISGLDLLVHKLDLRQYSQGFQLLI